MTLTLTLPAGEKIYTGRQVTFEAPCKSEGLTGLIVNNVTYALVDSRGNPLVENSFNSGAMISVIFNAEKQKAFVQNADTNKYLEDKFGDNSNLNKMLSKGPMILTSNQYGDTLPSTGVKGQIFFLKV